MSQHFSFKKLSLYSGAAGVGFVLGFFSSEGLLFQQMFRGSDNYDAVRHDKSTGYGLESILREHNEASVGAVEQRDSIEETLASLDQVAARLDDYQKAKKIQEDVQGLRDGLDEFEQYRTESIANVQRNMMARLEAINAFEKNLNDGSFAVYGQDPMVQNDLATVALIVTDSKDLQLPDSFEVPRNLVASGSEAKDLRVLIDQESLKWFAVMRAEIMFDEKDFTVHSPRVRDFRVTRDGYPEEIFWTITPKRAGSLTLTMRLGVHPERFDDHFAVPPPKDIVKTIQVFAEPITYDLIVDHAFRNWREIVNWLAAGFATAFGAFILWLFGAYYKKFRQG